MVSILARARCLILPASSPNAAAHDADQVLWQPEATGHRQWSSRRHSLRPFEYPEATDLERDFLCHKHQGNSLMPAAASSDTYAAADDLDAEAVSAPLGSSRCSGPEWLAPLTSALSQQKALPREYGCAPAASYARVPGQGPYHIAMVHGPALGSQRKLSIAMLGQLRPTASGIKAAAV